MLEEVLAPKCSAPYTSGIPHYFLRSSWPELPGTYYGDPIEPRTVKIWALEIGGAAGEPASGAGHRGDTVHITSAGRANLGMAQCHHRGW